MTPQHDHQMTACPLEDDVVIAFTDGHWEVGIAAAPASMSYPSGDSALAIAAAFSKAHGVDVWVAHDGAPCECIVPSHADMKTADGANKVTPSRTTSAATIGGRR